MPYTMAITDYGVITHKCGSPLRFVYSDEAVNESEIRFLSNLVVVLVLERRAQWHIPFEDEDEDDNADEDRRSPMIY